MSQKNYYQILEVDKTATQEDIKQAYRKKAIKYHPDKNQGDKAAEEKFKEVAEAYEVLSDPEKKRNYDAGGTGKKSSGFNGPGDMFNFFRGASNRNRQPSENLNIFAEIGVTFEEVISGKNIDLEYIINVKCKDCDGKKTKNANSVKKCQQCHGNGFVTISNGVMSIQTTCPSCSGDKIVITDPCKNCNGTGRTENKTKIIGLKVPSGINPNAKIMCKGKGHQSILSGSFGDLIISVGYLEHNLFKLQQNSNNGLFDTILECHVPLHVAIFGGKLKIPTLYGLKEVDIEKGTTFGDMNIIKECGLPDTKNNKGSQILIFNIEMPKTMTNKLIKELNKININEDTYPEYSKAVK